MSYQAQQDIEESSTHIVKSRSQSEISYTVHDSNHLTFWKRQKNYRDNKMISSCQRIWEEGRKNQYVGFSGSATTLYVTVMTETCHYTFVKTHRANDSREPKVNYGL